MYKSLKFLIMTQLCRYHYIAPMSWKQYFVTPWADCYEQVSTSAKGYVHMYIQRMCLLVVFGDLVRNRFAPIEFQYWTILLVLPAEQWPQLKFKLSREPLRLRVFGTLARILFCCSLLHFFKYNKAIFVGGSGANLRQLGWPDWANFRLVGYFWLWAVFDSYRNIKK
jgi:hypothetical protein